MGNQPTQEVDFDFDSIGPRSYTIQAGDTLGGIAANLNTNSAELRNMNTLGNIIKPGQTISVPEYEPKAIEEALVSEEMLMQYPEMPEEVKRAELEGHEDKAIKLHGANKDTIAFGIDLTESPEIARESLTRSGVSDFDFDALSAGDTRINITQEQADESSNMAYAKKASDSIAILKRNRVENLPKDIEDIALNLMYRGDIVFGEKSYRGALAKALQNKDYTKFIEIGQRHPVVKTRLEKYGL